MARVSGRVGGQAFPKNAPNDVHHLRVVARAFTHLQELRHAADYDGNRRWSRIAVLDSVRLAEAAVGSWKLARKTKLPRTICCNSWCTVETLHLGHDRFKQPNEAVAHLAADFQYFFVIELLRQDAGGHVSDAGDAEAFDAHMVGGDHFSYC